MNRSNTREALLDHDSFQLPQSGLFADLDTGAGSIALSDEFQGLAGATQLSIIGQWQRGLEMERRRALVRLFREVTRGDVGLPKKIDHFRLICGRLGLDCPSDMVILLQQV
jgi:hypothetical protein